jgi:hypothetical protein
MNGSKSLEFNNKASNGENQNKLKDSKGRHVKVIMEEDNQNSITDFYKQNQNFNKEQNDTMNNTAKKRSNTYFNGGVAETGVFSSDFNQNTYDQMTTPVKNSNPQNLMQINESNKYEEEDDKYFRRDRKSTYNNIFTSPKRITNTIITEKEKRTILEHYRTIYSLNKNSHSKLFDSNKKSEKKFPFFPVVSGQAGFNSLRNSMNILPNPNQENIKKQTIFVDRISPDNKDTISSSQKNSMFRSSIYTNLMSNTTKNNFNNTNTKIENTMNSSFYKNNKGKVNKTKLQTTYGPFLNIKNEYEQEIEIKNPEIKRSLEDINYYGPYFSHCPMCRHKNLDFYQTMEPHQCMKLLNYLKMEKSKIKIK